LRSLNHDGTLLWSVFLRDTITSSPALGDIDRDGYLEIVIGSDIHAESAFGTPNGGSIHVFAHDGAEMYGFPQHIDEIIQSSPALGDINGDGLWRAGDYVKRVVTARDNRGCRRAGGSA
jgi:hypothetical protein